MYGVNVCSVGIHGVPWKAHVSMKIVSRIGLQYVTADERASIFCIHTNTRKSIGGVRALRQTHVPVEEHDLTQC